MRCLILILFCGFISAEECHLNIVEYKDSKTLSSPDLSNPDKLLATKIAFGCVFASKDALTVIQSMEGNDPLNVLVIPRSSVVKMTPLDETKPAPHLEPQELPNATPESVDHGIRPNDRRMI